MVVVFVVVFTGEAKVGSEEPAVGRAAPVVVEPVGPVGIEKARVGCARVIAGSVTGSGCKAAARISTAG